MVEVVEKEYCNGEFPVRGLTAGERLKGEA